MLNSIRVTRSSATWVKSYQVAYGDLICGLFMMWTIKGIRITDLLTIMPVNIGITLINYMGDK